MSGLKSFVLLCSVLFTASTALAQDWVNHSTSDGTTVVKRHETGSVADGDKLYVLGGRGNKPVQVFNASQNKWSTLAPLPLEIHHFQPVILNGYLYAIGAFTCCFPTETSISDIYRLNLSTNTWETFGSIPAARLRGSAGTVVYNNKIYLVGGNTNGHSGGAVGWLDEYDPTTGNWRILPDAPNARDHFNAAVVGNKLVAASGRQTNLSFGGMVGPTDVYDFNTNSWNSTTNIPTPRAGAMLGIRNGNVIVMGGETDTQVEAHDEVEAYHVASDEWRTLPAMGQGRHGGAGGVIGNALHAITGNLIRGGGQEVTLHERLTLADSNNDGIFDFESNAGNTTPDADNDGLTDAEEIALQTDPLNPDSDGDSISDGNEVNQHNTNPLDPDTDNDGLQDSEELNQGTNPANSDSDSDGLSDIDEIQTHNTDPNNADSDGDTLSDNDELELYFTDPLLTDSDADGLDDQAELQIHNSNPNAWDSDGDGISDATEVANGTTPNNPDQDGDGILNSAEGTEDSDGDSIANHLDLDSDNDGISDVLENGGADNNNDGKLDISAGNQPTGSLLDTDQDGIYNFLDVDSDQDASTDLLESGQEDPQNNGRVLTSDLIDDNQNGWHDPLEGSIPFDTDADETANYIDLDSDDDGITDLVAAGFIDADDNGLVDTFTDNNGDGLHDNIVDLERVEVTQNENTNSLIGSNTNSDNPELEPIQAKSGGGCTIGSTGAGSDPTLPLIVLAFAAAIAQRRRQTQPK